MKFKTVAEYFEKINQESARLAITHLLAELLGKASSHEAIIISYLSLGTLRALYKTTQFNMADKLVARVVAQLLKIDIKSVEKEMKEYGDLGTVVGRHYTHHHAAEPTVLHIYEELEALEKMSGAGSQEEKSDYLYKLLAHVDPLSAQYIIRMVLGKLRLGFSDMTLIDALSWMLVENKSLHERIEHGYNICADIGLITGILKEYGIKGLEHIEITLGIPIRPAAAERLPTAEEIFDKIGPCVAQPKLDGFRLQIHYDNRRNANKYWFYSRNLHDMSEMFPDIVASLSSLKAQTLIAEGEAIAFDENTGSFVPFQETVKRKRKHGIEEAAAAYPLKLFLFDILYYDGESLLNKAHATRRELLKKVLTTHHSQIINIIDEESINSAHELEEYFLANIAAGLEGVVVKKPSSHYQPGKRNFNWIKLKYHAEHQLEDTLDVVVLGYYYGSGKRASFGIGAFLVGIYNSHKDRFETIAKVGTGLKDADWRYLKKQCDKIAVRSRPHGIICDKNLEPDVWVNPQIVCAVLADEITISPIHSAGKTEHQLGYALRFPRFVGYRPDKLVTEATTIDEVKTLFAAQNKLL